MPPKRKAAAVAEPPKRASRAKKEEPAPAPAPAKKAPAKGKGKAAAPAAPAPAKKAPAKKGAKAEVDPEIFIEKLLDVCKVLMTVCETVVADDEEDYSITTIENYLEHGKDLLDLLPEEARVPMMKMASRYQEAIDTSPPIGMGSLMYGEESDEEHDEDDEEDDIFAEVFNAEHFYFFKKFFTPAEAKAFIEAADDASEAALTSMFEEDDDEEEEEDEEDDELDDDDEVDWMVRVDRTLTRALCLTRLSSVSLPLPLQPTERRAFESHSRRTRTRRGRKPKTAPPVCVRVDRVTRGLDVQRVCRARRPTCGASSLCLSLRSLELSDGQREKRRRESL